LAIKDLNCLLLLERFIHMHALCGYQVRWHSPAWTLRKPNSTSFTEEHAQITHLSTIDSFEAKMKYYRTQLSFTINFKIFTAFRRVHNGNYCGSTSPSLTVRRCCLPVVTTLLMRCLSQQPPCRGPCRSWSYTLSMERNNKCACAGYLELITVNRTAWPKKSTQTQHNYDISNDKTAAAMKFYLAERILNRIQTCCICMTDNWTVLIVHRKSLKIILKSWWAQYSLQSTQKWLILPHRQDVCC